MIIACALNFAVFGSDNLSDSWATNVIPPRDNLLYFFTPPRGFSASSVCSGVLSQHSETLTGSPSANSARMMELEW